MVALVVGIAVVVVGIVVSIALHEIGHMVPAKKFGVRVSQYMVGFGPTLWSRRRGETEYGVKAIPAGGYVRLVGMFPPNPDGAREPASFARRIAFDAREASSEEIHPGEEHRAFYNLSAPKKVVVMLGGPFMNLVIAAVLMVVVVAGIGVSGASTTVGAVVPCVTGSSATTAPRECTDADPESPAVAAGLEPGDEVVSFGGTAVDSWDQLVSLINDAAGEPTPVVVVRDGTEVDLTITPAQVERQQVDADGTPVVDAAGDPVTEPGGYVGFSAAVERQRGSLADAGEALWDTVTATAGVVVTLPQNVYDVVRTTVAGEERDATSVMGPVGVGVVAVEVAGADAGVVDRVAIMLSLLASLNVALFVFNLIPLLPLDGGHVLNALYEGTKRTVARVRGLPRPGPADVARMMPVAYVMFVALVGVGVLLLVADVVNPVTLL
ncbi:RIP metalloprotease RseP [Sediminihabitans luteus]|uniref:RIP metalloprotease RseP n=1 Tax=Sediminihabitans luteus TaxID=1138585 RepID=A0A2M9CCE6_9CELL|nr:site-2 protease family protein [Sediminihabitans luteus]PJJ69006.1 RIP metalloprotease RseP [Sediminihabitans luteus]GII99390.1 peptidase [Sediminihabitans luteus]